MNKSLKAFLMGYIYFKVTTTSDTKYFWLYNSANKTKPSSGYFHFLGYNLFRMRWLQFFYRSNSIIDWTKVITKLKNAKF